MARVPGTETPKNRDGWSPGDSVRGRRSRAAAAQGVADRAGLVTEVRPGHVRVLFAPRTAALWLTNETVVAAPDSGDPDLHIVRHLLRVLGAVRVEFEDDEDGPELVLVCGELRPSALDEARFALGERLDSMVIEPAGVHEVAVRVRIATA